MLSNYETFQNKTEKHSLKKYMNSYGQAEIIYLEVNILFLKRLSLLTF